MYHSKSFVIANRAIDKLLPRIIKLCANQRLVQNFLTTRTYPTKWKKANIPPIHKKIDKQIVSNCLFVSFVSICSNLLKSLFLPNKFFEVKNMLFKHQCGFCPGNLYTFSTTCSHS